MQQKANAIYRVPCPGYNEDGIGKTYCNSVTRLNEHASHDNQPKYQHLSEYDVSTLHILLIYIDDQSLMLQQQMSVAKNTLLMLVFLTFGFWTPAASGPNCYF